jgi:hypothetical protein
MLTKINMSASRFAGQWARSTDKAACTMEFHIKTRGASPDLDAINDALTAIDPSAMADIDPVDLSLRIAAELGSAELLALLARAGYPADWKQLEQVPSVCCGACGG